MDFFRANILTIVAFFPLAGMIVLLFFNKENKNLHRWWANIVGFAGFFSYGCVDVAEINTCCGGRRAGDCEPGRGARGHITKHQQDPFSLLVCIR